MNDSQPVRVIKCRPQSAQHRVTLSRHTALSLTRSVGWKGVSIINYGSNNHNFCTVSVVEVPETL